MMGKPNHACYWEWVPEQGFKRKFFPPRWSSKVLESNNYCPSPTSQLGTRCGILCRQARLTAIPQQNDGFYSHHPGHRGHSQPSARSGPQKDGPYWQQDAGASGHAVNAEQTLISERGIKRARFAKQSSSPAFWQAMLRFTQNSSLSQVTLAIGIMSYEQDMVKMWRFPLVHNFYSYSSNRQVERWGLSCLLWFPHWCDSQGWWHGHSVSDAARDGRAAASSYLAPETSG